MLMNDNEEPKVDEEFSFLQETIKKEPVNKKKVANKIITIGLLGLLFGVFASLGFFAVKPWAESHFKANPTTVTIPDDEVTTDSNTTTEEPAVPVLDVTSYRELYSGLYQVASGAAKSVVSVKGIKSDDGWIEKDFDTENSVSGVIVYDNGQELLILTENTILKDAQKLIVTFADGSNYDAALKKKENNLGLAIISVARSAITDTTWSQIQVATLGNSNTVSRGNPIIVIGNPFGYAKGLGYGVVSSSANEISFLDGDYGIISTDIAAAANGTGVLINLSGEVIGLMSQKASGGDNMNLVTGMAISGLKNTIELLSNGKGVPYIGIRGTDITETIASAQGLPQGIYVKETATDSPGMVAGIQRGDIINKVDSKKVSTFAAFHSALMGYNVGDEIKISGQRLGGNGYVDIDFTVTVGSLE